jgi:hypothetical protein
MLRYRHFPAFNRLVDDAQKAGLQVRLRVGERVQFACKRGEEYRKLTRVEIWIDSTAPAIASAVIDDDLESAALDLLRRAA